MTASTNLSINERQLLLLVYQVPFATEEEMHMNDYTCLWPSPLIHMVCLDGVRTQKNGKEAHPENMMLRQTFDH